MTRATSSLLWLCLPGLLGCSKPPTLLVQVSQVPADAARLEVSLGLGGQAARPIEPYTVDPAIRKPELSFVLRLPDGVAGTATVGVGAFDEAGCLLSRGQGEGDVAAEGLPVAMVALGAPDCTKSTPLLLGATPDLAATTGGETVTLSGWGFQRGANVLFSDTPALFVTWRTLGEVMVGAPPRRDGHGKVRLKIINPDGTQAERSDLFAYFSTSLDFISYPFTGPAQPTALAFDIVDDNSFPDFVLTGSGMSVVAVGLFNNGELSSLSNYMVGRAPSFVAIGDVNRDGRKDLAVANRDDSNVSVLLNQGAGVFSTQATADYDVGTGPRMVAVADVNRDGAPDLITANQGDGTVTVLRNQGDGTFPAGLRADYPVGAGPESLSLGDLDGDGSLDVIVANRGGTTLTVLENGGDGTFPMGRRRDIEVGAEPTTVVVADFDGDGGLDAAVPLYGGDQVVVLLSRGGLAQAAPAGYAVGSDPLGLTVGDFNGDGQPDLATTNEGDGNITVLLNGGGTFSAFGKRFPAGSAPSQIIAGDLDQDGRTDFGVINRGAVQVLLNRS